ncbi:unnamed protein product [Heligmosomoides polygyrus]|uniref:DDE_Tnp_ISL3 domain-containing protein n=1 Tax=Heligmosomoides polygyrus TaxID=6339 RepID=A0A183FX16_HELPZ|nr:unnamed protein product [Heligmosomoides polygyrus]
MKMVVAAKERLYHFFSACAPQTGCFDQAKEEFCNLLDKKTAEVPAKVLVTDAKIVPYETVAPQHRPLICHFEDRPSEAEAGRAMRCTENQVVANDREGSSCDFSRTLLTVTTVDETWRKATDTIRQAAQSGLGITKHGRCKLESTF